MQTFIKIQKSNLVSAVCVVIIRGIYAENSQDGKYAELDMFIEAYCFHVPEIFAKKATEGTIKRVPIAKIRNKMNAQVQKIRRHEKLYGDIIYVMICCV